MIINGITATNRPTTLNILISIIITPVIIIIHPVILGATITKEIDGGGIMMITMMTAVKMTMTMITGDGGGTGEEGIKPRDITGVIEMDIGLSVHIEKVNKSIIIFFILV